MGYARTTSRGNKLAGHFQVERACGSAPEPERDSAE